jgi:hypothetical protein
MTYMVRIYTEHDHSAHDDTPHDTADEAFGQVYLEPLPLPELATKKIDTPCGFSIFHEGVCIHTQDGADIGYEI